LDATNSQCVANLQAEIHTLQGENETLYEKIKRMEGRFDALIKQTTEIETNRSRLEREISKVRAELSTKRSLLQHVDAQNADLKAAVAAATEENRNLHEQLQLKLEELHEFQSEAKGASEKYNQSMKVWKEEKRAIVKQKADSSKKLDACEDELQAYFNENAKLEKQLKQVSFF
jgi:chromosome segregation ATPase